MASASQRTSPTIVARSSLLPRPASTKRAFEDNNNNARCGGMLTVPTSGRMRYDILTSVLATFISARSPSPCGG